MSKLSRRAMLRAAAASLAAGSMTLEAAQHVHQAVSQARKAAGPYRPKLFNAHEYATLRQLADMIVPADEQSKGALDAGAPEFIDLMASQNEEIAAIYTGGLAWLDAAMQRRSSARFIEAAPAERLALLTLIAYRKNDSPELGPGIRFFDWARKMVVDAYYTSPAGIEQLGYKGNGAMEVFHVPMEAIEYALKRSPLQ